ncbi:MAG: hypothetical protein KH230_09810 [Enterocloster asparagiformis]|nr:hypothetical protein [Enterocloster asparagiformis]
MSYAYYSLIRPISIGTYPQNGLVEGEIPNVQNYEIIYISTIDASMREANLETIFQNFNMTQLEKFYGHSLSVSDIVVISSSRSSYFVDTFGFKNLPGFLDERTAAKIAYGVDVREEFKACKMITKMGLKSPEIERLGDRMEKINKSYGKIFKFVDRRNRRRKERQVLPE